MYYFLTSLKTQKSPLNLLTATGFSLAGCDGTRSAPSALHFVPRCLQSALLSRRKLRFGPEKLINSSFFAAGDNNSLEIN